MAASRTAEVGVDFERCDAFKMGLLIASKKEGRGSLGEIGTEGMWFLGNGTPACLQAGRV